MTPAGQEAALLREGAGDLGVQLDAGAIERLLEYLDLLYLWNRRGRLTAIERSGAVRLHLLDSLAILPLLAAGPTVVDLGSGAGLPGIPIAVADPQRHLVLVESKRRRCSFLLEAVRELGLGNCTVLEEDARVLAASGRLHANVTARAFLPPAELVSLAAPMIEPGGRLIVMGARDEIETGVLWQAPADCRLVETRTLVLPGGNEQRRIVVLER